MSKVVVKSFRIDKDVNDKMAEISDSFGVSQNDLVNTVMRLYLNIPTLESKILDKNPNIRMNTTFKAGVEIKEPKRVGVIGSGIATPLVAIDVIKDNLSKTDGVNKGVSEGVPEGINEGINVFGNTVVTIQEPEEGED